MDKNGYNKSLFNSEDGVCYLTGRRCDTARHEVFNKHTRAYSKEDGLWIAVSPEVHERIHSDYKLWNELKKQAEELWLLEDWDRSINDFVERYGKNYM